MPLLKLVSIRDIRSMLSKCIRLWLRQFCGMEVQNKVGIISVYDSAFAHLPRTTIEHTRIYKNIEEFLYPKAKSSEIYSKIVLLTYCIFSSWCPRGIVTYFINKLGNTITTIHNVIVPRRRIDNSLLDWSWEIIFLGCSLITLR